MGKFESIFELDKKLMDYGSVLLSLLRLNSLVRDKEYLLKNKTIKDLKDNDTCFIIGLGPSLKKVDLGKLQGDIIVTNRFFNVDGAEKITPKFYCMTDNYFFLEEGVNELEKAVSMFPKSNFMLNGKYRREAENAINGRVNTYYAYMLGGLFSDKKEIDFTRRVPLMVNIVGFAIMLALGMQYKKIILLGCDFNSFASRKPVHCYSDSITERQISMAFELFCYSFVADTHYQLNNYAEKHGISIVNASEGSLIDAYEYDEKLIKRYKKES